MVNTPPALPIRELNTYCSTAANTGTSLTIAGHTSLTVAMSNFTGFVTGRWYDPSNGTFTAIAGSPFVNSGSRDFTMPGYNADGDPDWLLLLNTARTDATLNWFTAEDYPPGPDRSTGGVLLRWQTGYEVANLGFNIYRDESGAVRSSPRSRIMRIPTM
jgi:hypothetical protein